MPSNFIQQQNIQDTEYYRYLHVEDWYEAINKHASRLHIIHINICSLRKHFNELLVLLEDCINSLDVICLTEINIKQEELYRYHINGFNMYAWTRHVRRGGGILIFVKSKYTFVTKKLPSEYCEVLAGELKLSNYITDIFVVYRPPNTNKAAFITELNGLLHSVPRRNNLILIGDININILEQNVEMSANRYLDMLSELGLQCGLRDVTRESVVIGRRVASCIDHIFVRTDSVSALQVYTVENRLADHYLIGLTAELDKHLVNRDSRVKYNNKKISLKLQDISWSNLLAKQDAIELYNSVNKIFQDIYKTCTFQCTSIEGRATQPWVNKYLQTQIEKKDYLFRK